jgi:hypothetical protein
MNDNKLSEKDLKSIMDYYIKKDLTPISRIFINFNVIKDFKLMALFMLNKDKYKIIYNQIDKYNKRYDNDIVKYFDDITTTEEEIKEFLLDSRNRNILELSPVTNIHLVLEDLIKEILIHNQACPNNPGKLNIYFYNKYFNLSDSFKLKFKNYLDNGNGTNFHYINKDLNELDSNFINSIDYFFIDNIHELLAKKTIFQEDLYNFKLLNKYICSTKVITEEKKDLSEELMLENTELLLRIFTNFNYIDRYLIT